MSLIFVQLCVNMREREKYINLICSQPCHFYTTKSLIFPRYMYRVVTLVGKLGYRHRTIRKFERPHLTLFHGTPPGKFFIYCRESMVGCVTFLNTIYCNGNAKLRLINSRNEDGWTPCHVMARSKKITQ
jgi:hypothetical protein